MQLGSTSLLEPSQILWGYGVRLQSSIIPMQIEKHNENPRSIEKEIGGGLGWLVAPGVG